MGRSTGFLKRYLKRNGSKVLTGILLILVVLFMFAYECKKDAEDDLKISEYKEYAKKYSLENGVELKLVLAIIKCESNFDEKALSRAGACGLMQLMPKTFKWLGGTDEEDIFDPETNIKYGCKYLRYLFGRFEDIETVIAAYNAGEGNVSLWLSDNAHSDDGKTLKSIPFAETASYVRRVMAQYSG